MTDEQKEKFFSWYSLRTPLIGAARVPQIIADIEAAYGKKTWGAVGVFLPSFPFPFISFPSTRHAKTIIAVLLGRQRSLPYLWT